MQILNIILEAWLIIQHFMKCIYLRLILAAYGFIGVSVFVVQ